MRVLVVAISIVHGSLLVPLASCDPVADGEGEGEGRGEGEGEGEPVIEDGPGAVGDTCSFNADCQRALRCACTEEDGCACAEGTRGTGQSGVDSCTSGDDCATSLCLEGPGDELICSGPCVDDDDCGGALPVCAEIAFVGRICIRAA